MEAILADPRFEDFINRLIDQRVPQRITSALVPQLRCLANQLFLQCEATYSGASSRGFTLPPSPVAPMISAWPESKERWLGLCQRFPGLGGTFATFDQNCRELRLNRNEEQHVEAVEDVLQTLHLLAPDYDQQRLQEIDPFLHAVVSSADEIVAQFLAAPRLLKLAQVTLQICKDRLDYHPVETWMWQKPKNREKVNLFISMALQEVPALREVALCNDLSDFAASADAVFEKARDFGPTKLSYPLDELQGRIHRCLDLGILQSVQAQHPFAPGRRVRGAAIFFLSVAKKWTMVLEGIEVTPRVTIPSNGARCLKHPHPCRALLLSGRDDEGALADSSGCTAAGGGAEVAQEDPFEVPPGVGPEGGPLAPVPRIRLGPRRFVVIVEAPRAVHPSGVQHLTATAAAASSSALSASTTSGGCGGGGARDSSPGGRLGLVPEQLVVEALARRPHLLRRCDLAATAADAALSAVFMCIYVCL
ncbi:hypothetical protein VOLCADRAFT_105383 [Volvox carteri f. nagariensis]|uniref:Uncharacterized protein n=1 Tax=Volvox carteri f. nagariensis TaxID=3068 RepID=D8U0H0_VOLCA|nr:uncharacterized protein VOLCADRAFT_105383 [Volvox carteri f. nagariensis]EFJ46632.1 hypothetical protein VOLCADRAFT_105383 [Volvox carteri f. nagariensis]|eukprot:XP_002952161.1 hypothetical protein VOLCADRAFT_105383 [Volvox carteri f. nagariensis]